jgi:histidinol-phosphate aminotransferase
MRSIHFDTRSTSTGEGGRVNGGSPVNRRLKLDLNEMPYNPPQNLIRAAERGLESLNRYADTDALRKLTVLLAGYAGVSSERIIIGPGSDLLLREMVLCFAGRRKVVMISPTFFPTMLVARRLARKLVRIRLSRPEFTLPREPLLEELEEPSLVIVDNPNNPTGRLVLDREIVERILDRPDTLLLVDEAYFEFSGLTFAAMVEEHKNLALARTLDKAFGLAGVRVGYLIAGQTFLRGFVPSFAFLPQPSLEAATEALLQPDYMWKNVQRTVSEREKLARELEMLGAQIFQSSTNFLLFRSDVPALADELRDRGILVMDVSSQLGAGFIRLTVGTPQENEEFMLEYRTIKNETEGQGRTYDYGSG